MNDNSTSKSDETAGMKIARWASWAVIAALGVFFLAYTALYH